MARQSVPVATSGTQTLSPISPSTLAVLQRVALDEGGLSIADDRIDFLVARLANEVDRLGQGDFATYARRIDSAQSTGERRRFIEALTTHTTSFFREKVQYEWLENHGIPAIVAHHGRPREITIWSAACSSGQELYSAVIGSFVALEKHGLNGFAVTGVGTDLSQKILRRAERAVYSGEEIQSLPLPLRHRYLLSSKANGDVFRIAPTIRERTRWTQANLTRGADLNGIRTDIAFLRNVLIYFDPPTRDRVLKNVIGRINPGGYLLTGHSETIRGEAFGLKPLKPSIYHKEA